MLNKIRQSEIKTCSKNPMILQVSFQVCSDFHCWKGLKKTRLNQTERSSAVDKEIMLKFVKALGDACQHVLVIKSGNILKWFHLFSEPFDSSSYAAAYQ